MEETAAEAEAAAVDAVAAAAALVEVPAEEPAVSAGAPLAMNYAEAVAKEAPEAAAGAAGAPAEQAAPAISASAAKGIEGALQQIVGQLDLVAKAVANMEDRLGKNEQDIGAMKALLNEAWAAS